MEDKENYDKIMTIKNAGQNDDNHGKEMQVKAISHGVFVEMLYSYGTKAIQGLTLAATLIPEHDS